MLARTLLLACVIVAIGFPVAAQDASGSASGQQTPRASGLADFVKRHMPVVDQGDGIHLSKHFAVVFGDIKPGEGIAAGGAVSNTFGTEGFVQLKGVYSTRQFSLAQLRLDSPKWASEHFWVTTRARWQNAPTLAEFPLGANARLAGFDYSERRLELAAMGVLRVTTHVRLEAGGGAERYVINGGELLPSNEEALTSIPPLAGLDARTWFERLSARAIVDYRAPAHAYPRSGTYIVADADDYRDWQDRRFSFYGFNGVAEHLVPTFGGRGVADITGRAWLTSPASGSTVPFFLMPTLGGGDYLEGYRLYRFRDRDAVLLRGEYRWAIHEFIDLAGAYEIGTVAPSVRAFRADGLKHSVSAGLRVHTARALVLGVDLAHSREGFEFNVNFSAPH